MFELILVTFFITVKKQTPCPGQHIEGMVCLAYGPRRMKVRYAGQHGSKQQTWWMEQKPKDHMQGAELKLGSGKNEPDMVHDS